MSKGQPQKTRNPYPYDIPEVKCPSEGILKALHPAQVLEFFRIEALLRSASVHRLYSQCKTSSGRMMERPLFSRYGFTWDAIDGAHHVLLWNPDPMFMAPPWFPPIPVGQSDKLSRAGVIDVGASVREGHALSWSTLMQDTGPRFLYLAIDNMTPPGTIIDALRPILKERHALTEQMPPIDTITIYNGMSSDGDMISDDDIFDDSVTDDNINADNEMTTASEIATDEDDHMKKGFIQPHNAWKKSPIRDVEKWLNYFRCYDFRRCDGLTFGQIGKTVYATEKEQEKKRDRAEKAVARAEQLIEQAESNKWPPEIR